MRLALFALLLAAPLLAAAGAAEPDGFRMDNYNAPVPETVAGGQAVDAQALAAAMANGAIAIDVMPAARRPPTLAADRPWMPPPRMDVPGSLWWPEVGRGAISPALDAWFRARLAAVTGGQTGQGNRILLQGRLLDELERRQARHRLWLQKGAVVPQWGRRLGRGGTSPARGNARDGAGGLDRQRLIVIPNPIECFSQGPLTPALSPRRERAGCGPFPNVEDNFGVPSPRPHPLLRQQKMQARQGVLARRRTG